MSLPRLSVRRIRATGVEVPMKLPLSTSAGTIRSAPLLLIDLETEEGITGRSYLFCLKRRASLSQRSAGAMRSPFTLRSTSASTVAIAGATALS